MPSEIIVRSARLPEAKAISGLIAEYAARGIMLPRAPESIIEEIRNFFVAIVDNEIVGCCAVAFFTEELAEIRSLVVKESFQRKGIGRELVLRTEQELREEGIRRSFALTLQNSFFEKVGYHRVEKTRYPQKIWKDCLNCPKIMQCDEIAVEKDLV